MMADKKYSVILEKVGNHPLMTTKILCGELGLGSLLLPKQATSLQSNG